MARTAISDEERKTRRKASFAKYRAKNLERIRARDRAIKANERAANPEAVSAASIARAAKWRAENPEKSKTSRKAGLAKWIAANPEKAKRMDIEKSARWRMNHPDKATIIGRASMAKRRAEKPDDVYAIYHRYRSRREESTEQYTASELSALRLKHGSTCAACDTRKSGTKNGRMTIDHIKPLSKGGSNGISNIQFLCVSCNCAKGNRY